MPDVTARVAILRAQLREEALADGVDLTALAVAMGEVSGSDIREIVRQAKMHRAKRFLLTAKESEAMVTDGASAKDEEKKGESRNNGNAGAGSSNTAVTVSAKNGGSVYLRPLNTENFEYALSKYRQSGMIFCTPAPQLLQNMSLTSRSVVCVISLI
jgi:SpoVK/Ycf46/Vps4 family AAA+-type ATPase